MVLALPKLEVPLAPLLGRIELSQPANAVLASASTAAEAVLLLEEGGFKNEAVRLTAHALPKREAVWWVCMCAHGVSDANGSEFDAQALEAAESWVRKPTDDALRRAAWDAAQRTDFKSPEAWAAVAAFWSGGSIAPPGQPRVPPGDHLTGVAVSGGVILASVRRRPERAGQRLDSFLASARDIATGGAGRLQPEDG